jgi:P pilus assembly chaperone PapD
MLPTTDTKKVTILFAVCFTLLFATSTFAQVSIAPTALFFDNQSRFQSLTVSNGGQQAQEISISTEFGYPTSKDGNIINANDSTLKKQKSIADWVKVFPQNFTLQPQQRQTVRFVIRSPSNLQEGGYWSRVRIQSNPVSPPIESVDEGQVGAQINLVVNQVIAAHYRTQNAQTSVNVTDVTFTQVDSTNTGQIGISMEQTGNAPFIGSISIKVTDQNGNNVYQTITTNSVYTSITRNFNMDLSNINPGTYTVTGEVRSERRDINQENLLQIKPVSFQKQITIE